MYGILFIENFSKYNFKISKLRWKISSQHEKLDFQNSSLMEDSFANLYFSFMNKTLSCIMENTNGCGMLEAAQPVAYALKQYDDWLKPYCMNVMVDQMLQSLPNCTVQYLDGFNFLLVHSTNFTQDFCALHMHVSSHCEDTKNLPALPRYNQAKMYARGAMISWMCERSKSVKEGNV